MWYLLAGACVVVVSVWLFRRRPHTTVRQYRWQEQFKLAKEAAAKEKLVRKVNSLLPRLKSDDFELAAWLTAQDEKGFGNFEWLLEQVETHELDECEDKLRQAYFYAESLCDYYDSREALERLHGKFQDAMRSSPLYRIKTLEELREGLRQAPIYTQERLGREWRLDTSHKALEAMLHNFVRERCQELATMIESQTQLYAFHRFVRTWREQGVEELAYPSNWKDLVDTYAPFAPDALRELD